MGLTIHKINASTQALNKWVKSPLSFSHDSTAGLMVLGLSTAGLAVLSGLTLLGFAAYQTLQCEL